MDFLTLELLRSLPYGRMDLKLVVSGERYGGAAFHADMGAWIETLRSRRVPR
jgi:hypothetical protein